MIADNRKKTILYVNHTALLGGGELALLALVRELDKSRYQPIVLLFSDGPLVAEMRELATTIVLPLPDEILKSRRGSFKVSRLPMKQVVGLMTFLFQLQRKIEEIAPHVIHTNSLKANVFGGLLGRICEIPVVWHVRDRIHEDYMSQGSARVLRLLGRWLPQAVIANSLATLATMRLPQAKQGVAIASGVDLDPFVAAAEGTQTLSHAVSHGHPVRIGIIGRLSPWKGQDVFLRAAAKVHNAFPNTQFLVIGAAMFGDQDHERVLHDLAAELGLNECTTFTGFRRDVPEVMAQLHIVVHASTTAEPFGQVIVQAMAAGKPVIASEGGGASEVMEEGKCGFLTPRGDYEALADAIKMMICNPGAAEQAAALARTRALARYGAQFTTRAVQSVYEEIL
jgi:glycosyltransferase involved in cell wall biosynthesis